MKSIRQLLVSFMVSHQLATELCHKPIQLIFTHPVNRHQIISNIKPVIYIFTHESLQQRDVVYKISQLQRSDIQCLGGLNRFL